LLASTAAWSQTPELKFIADTLIVQADGTYERDPDLATMMHFRSNDPDAFSTGFCYVYR